MTRANQTKCQIILTETAFSLLIYVMMIAIFLMVSNYLLDEINRKIKNQTLMDKLVNIAEYSVNSGLAADGPAGTREPNLLIQKPTSFWISYSEELRTRSGLSKLRILDTNMEQDEFELCLSDTMFEIADQNAPRSSGKIVPIVICGSN